MSAQSGRRWRRRPLRFCDSRTRVSELDRLAVEEPLEIRIDGSAVAVTMRTPGHDEELAVGFCLSEGIPARSARLPDDFAANTVDVEVDGPFDRAAVQRNFYTSSSCGVCGKGALEAVAVSVPRVHSELRAPLGRRSLRCRIGSAQSRRLSMQPAACTRQVSSMPRASSAAFARTSVVTTRWTR